jgi:hypothetical protein
MNPLRELAPLDSILEAGVSNPAWVKDVVRQMQRIAGRRAAAALRQRAPTAGLHLATFGYSNLVATAVRRSRSNSLDSGQVIDAAGEWEISAHLGPKGGW